MTDSNGGARASRELAPVVLPAAAVIGATSAAVSGGP
jgi:hypothetical protein